MGGEAVINDPLARFAEEHRTTLRSLDRLDAAARALAQGDAPASALRAAGEVCAHLATAVRGHYDNEERALFGQIAEEAPVASFVDEHRTLRQLETDLEAALDGPTPDQDVPPVAQSLIALLRAHVEREDRILFPMARAILGPEGLAEAARLLR